MNPLSLATDGMLPESEYKSLQLAAIGYYFTEVETSAPRAGASSSAGGAFGPGGGTLGLGIRRRRLPRPVQDIGQHNTKFKLMAKHYRSAAIALVTSDSIIEERIAAAFGLLSDDES